MAKIEHTAKTMYGQLEVHLLELYDGAIKEEDIMGWADAHCHRMVRAFYVQRGKFAAKTLYISTVEGVGEAMREVQWLWDKRKTKAGTEAKSLQEAMKTTMKYLKKALEGRVREDEWLGEVREFTRSLEALARMVDALDAGANITDFPNLCIKIDHEPEERGR